MLWQEGSRYKRLEFLGADAYGWVCKAPNKQTKEFIAMKLVKDVMQSKSILKRVHWEVMQSKSTKYFFSEMRA